LSRPLFDRQMARLEAGKGEDFDPRTLAVWYDEMTRLGWSDDFFVERCKAVMGAKVYGKISFDMFVDSPALFTREEVAEEVERTINKRKQAYIDMLRGTRWSVNQLAEEGLYELTGLFYAKRAEEKETLMDKIKPFIKSLLTEDGRIK